jgi:hypothetical protein
MWSPSPAGSLPNAALARVGMDVDGDGIEFGTDGDLVIAQLALAQVVRNEVRRKVAQYMSEGEFLT